MGPRPGIIDIFDITVDHTDGTIVAWERSEDPLLLREAIRFDPMTSEMFVRGEMCGKAPTLQLSLARYYLDVENLSKSFGGQISVDQLPDLSKSAQFVSFLKLANGERRT